MRVLAVGQLGRLVERKGDRVGERLLLLEPGDDRRVVGRRGRESDACEATARLEGGLASVHPQLGEDELVVLGPADRGHRRVVLRRPTKQRRPADVDHLDHVLVLDLETADDLLERVEADADEVEGLDRVLGELRAVGLERRPSEDSRMDPRVQRLDATFE